MAKRKGTNNDLQNSAHKTKDRATRTTLQQAVNSGAPEGNTNIRLSYQKLYHTRIHNRKIWVDLTTYKYSQ